MSKIVSDLDLFGNNIDKVTERIKGLSIEDAKLVMSLSNVDKYTQSCALNNLGFSASAINAANGVKTEASAVVADTTAKTANLSITNLLSVAWAKLTAIIKANPIIAIATATIAVLYGVAKVIERLHVSMDELKESTKESINTLSSLNSEVEGLEDKIKSLNDQISSLDPITDSDDIEKLKLESAELENQLAILKEKQR